MGSLTRRLIALNQQQKFLILSLVDLSLVPLSFWLAVVLVYGQGSAPRIVEETWAFLPFLLLAGFALQLITGMHRLKLKDYVGDAILRTLGIALALGICSYLLSRIASNGLGPRVHVVFALVLFIAEFGCRRLMYAVLTQIYLRSNVVSRIAIYGAGRTGMTLARELRNRSGWMVHAFIDDNATLNGMNLNGLPIYSGVHVGRLIERYKINRVILAMPSLSTDKQTFISKRLTKMGLRVQTLPAFSQLEGDSVLMSKLRPAGPAALLPRATLDSALSQGAEAYRGRNVLISGAGGSIGVELCRQVMACRPARLVLFEMSELALYNAEAEMRVLGEAIGCDIVPVLGSVADGVHVAEVLARYEIDAVLHAAAYKHVPLVEMNPRVGLANNALGTAVIARAAKVAGVRHFVLVSSDKAVRPGNLMGASKRLAELVVQDLAARSQRTIFSIVRFGNVMGSSGSVIPLFREQIARGGPVTLTDPGVTRYFMTIPEAARLVLLAGSFAEGGEVYVLDMGKPMRIYDLACKLIAAAGYTLRDDDHPDGDIEIVTTGLRPGEKLHEELMVRKGAQTTAHPKIIRVREDSLSELEMAAVLRDLRDRVDAGDLPGVISVVARAVPEYDPQSLPEGALQMRIAHARDHARAAATQAQDGTTGEHPAP